MIFWAALLHALIVSLVGLAIVLALEDIADRLDYATIGSARVPALECQEDELITWVDARLACAPIEYYQEVK